MRKKIPKLPKCIQEIRSKYPDGVFTKKNFLNKIKPGTSFYHVGSNYGEGPTEPRKVFFNDRDKINLTDIVFGYKGVFLSQQEAWSYYRDILERSLTDTEFKTFLRKQKDEGNTQLNTLIIAD